MKCALIIPAWQPEEIFSSKTSGAQINYWQPLGTLYVASSIKASGREVRFINGAFKSHVEILDEIKETSPDFVGLYATTFGWNKAKQTAMDIKALNPNIFICAGGPYPVALKDNCLLDDGGSIDAVITGEGEATVVEILDRLEKGKSLEGVKGIAYRDNGRVKLNADRPLIEDLDTIAFPDRGLLGDSMLYLPPPATYKRRPVAVMITSRGCNRRCIYCFQIDSKRTLGIRYRSVANVIEEIKVILIQGYREIKFLDDTLAADYKRAMELMKEIKRNRLDFSWFASACVNQVDLPLLEAFKEAGCWAILFGAESGVQKDLDTIRKGITLEQTRKAVSFAKKAGLKVLTPFLFGIPGQTFQDGLKSIDFACELNPDIANFHSLTPFPGTELYDNSQKYGKLSVDLTDYTYQGIAFTPYTLSRDQIAELRQTAFRRFYSRPSFLVKRFFQMRNYNDLKSAFYGLKSLFWLFVKKDIFRRRA